MTGSFLHPFARPARESFIRLVSGSGATVRTADGRDLIDGMASLWYCNIGHGRRDMAEVIAQQVSTLEAYSAFDPFTTDPADGLAERIAGLSGIPGARVFFTGSGSEAIDSVMKIARTAQVQAGHPERTLIITRTRGYHGTNYGGTSAQGIAPNKTGWGTLLDDVIQVDADDIEAMSLTIEKNKGRLAAIIAEPVQGAGGVFPATTEYLQGLRRLCDSNGAYLVFDEVITGFGRLGEWFAALRHGVTPDLITFAKAVTSGYQPLGGVICARSVTAPLENDPAFFLRHGYTYSGHATVCAAASKNLDILAEEGLLPRSVVIGEQIAAGLGALAADGVIAGVRGEGAVWAAALKPDQDAVAIRDRMLELGAITRAINDCNTFCPPLVITDAQISTMLDIFAAAASGR